MPASGERQTTLRCGDVSELLPAYLSHTLEEEISRRLDTHLASCVACRQEERDARTAMALYEGHLPVELLLDYALRQPMPSERRGLVESHLARCERCADEVSTVRAEAPAPAAARHPAATGSAPDRLRALAWAASVAAVVASAGWFWTWWQLAPGHPPQVATARPNLPVFELLPAVQAPLRQAGPAGETTVNRLPLREGTEEVVLVLLAGGEGCASGCLLEIRDAAGETRRLEGLLPTSDGHVTLSLPAAWLPTEGSLLVRQSASGETVAAYRVEARGSRNATP